MGTYARTNRTSYVNNDPASTNHAIAQRVRGGGKAPVVNHAMIAQRQGIYPTTAPMTIVGADVLRCPEQEGSVYHRMIPTVAPDALHEAIAKPARC